MSPGFHLPLPPFLQNYRRRHSSHPPPQPPLSPPPPPPPPSVRWVTRPDTALPPTYDQTWDTVRNNDVWPLFIRASKSNYKAHAMQNILNKPNWFLALESDKDTASDVLWTNVIRLPQDPDYHAKHWSLQFLHYAVVENDLPPLPSEFASMIVFEVIFTVLTPYPEEWPAGVESISRLTRCPSTDILDSFKLRRQFERSSPENLESNSQTRTITHRSSSPGGHFRHHRIRKDAFDYLQRHGKMERLLYDEGAFRSVLIHDLRHLAEHRRGGRKFFPDASFFE